jgi:hypothetical protein
MPSLLPVSKMENIEPTSPMPMTATRSPRRLNTTYGLTSRPSSFGEYAEGSKR